MTRQLLHFCAVWLCLANLALAAEPATQSAPATAPATSSTSTADTKQHKLSPGDVVTFRITEDRDPPGTPEKQLTVTDSGELDIPYIGLIPAKDKTCKEIVTQITPLLEKDFYVKATVAMAFSYSTKTSTGLGRVYVYGEVKSPGAVLVPPNETFTASKAIVAAGGFADFAKQNKVKIFRKQEGKVQTFELDMDEIFKKGRLEKDLAVEPDDIISVPKRAINF